MQNDYLKIELCSKKICVIIGKIPPRIIQIGISIVFLCFIILGLLAFKFPYKITFNGTAVYYKSDSLVYFNVYIPFDKCNELHLPTIVYLQTENGDLNFNVTLKNICDSVIINDNGVWKKGVTVANYPLKIKNHKVIIIKKTSFVAYFVSKSNTFAKRIINEY